MVVDLIKIAKVIPLHTSESVLLVSNYRLPISLLLSYLVKYLKDLYLIVRQDLFKINWDFKKINRLN